MRPWGTQLTEEDQGSFQNVNFFLAERPPQAFWGGPQRPQVHSGKSERGQKRKGSSPSPSLSPHLGEDGVKEKQGPGPLTVLTLFPASRLVLWATIYFLISKRRP